MPRMQSDMDSLEAGLKKVQSDLRHFKEETESDLAEEKSKVSTKEDVN